MPASIEDDFDPNSIVGKMLRKQRAADAPKAKAPPATGPVPPPPRPGALASLDATSVLQRRLRNAGVE